MLRHHEERALRARMKSPQVVAAFDVLVDRFSAMDVFEARANIEGQKKAVALRCQGRSMLAFICNAEWLLFYVRKPAFNSGVISLEQVVTEWSGFERSARSNPDNCEAICRIRDAETAESIVAHVEALVPDFRRL